MLDRVREPADRGCDDGSAVGHRLARDDAVPLPAGWASDDGRPLVEGEQLPARNEAVGFRNAVSQRPVANENAWEPLGRFEELADSLLTREPAGVQNVRWLLRRADLLRHVNAARHEAHVSRAERACGHGQRRRRTEDEPGSAQQPPERPGRTARQLDVGAPQLYDERPPRCESGKRGREPVCVDEIGSTRCPPGGPGVREKEERKREQQPRPPPEVPHDPVPVREPEVRKRVRRHNDDLDAGVPQARDGVAHEHPGHVVRAARIRRRENENLQGVRAARPNTTGNATASAAKT